jgi:hypothetical protein
MNKRGLLPPIAKTVSSYGRKSSYICYVTALTWSCLHTYIKYCMKLYVYILYTVPKAMADVIVNNEKKRHSSYGMKSFIP